MITSLSRAGFVRAWTTSALVLLAACGVDATGRSAVRWSLRERALLAQFTPIPAPAPSASNRFADDQRAAELGRRLFFDERLGPTGRVSCATCHDPERAFTDGRATSVGVAETDRNTPTLLGAAYAPFLNWDGRKDSLWSQALGPLEDPREMGSHRLLVARVVGQEYGAAFEDVFGPLPGWLSTLDLQTREDAVARWADASPVERVAVDGIFASVGKAVAAFERSLVPSGSPFDAYVEAMRRGGDAAGWLSEAALRGLRAFLTSGCVHCHNGPLFTDQAFHRMGLPSHGDAVVSEGRAAGIRALLEDPFRSDGPYSDGVSEALLYLDTDTEATRGAPRTPTLRNVGRTAPYGHAGQFETLEEVLASYAAAPRRARRGEVDPILAELDEDLDGPALVAFLRSLTDAAPIAGAPSSLRRPDSQR